MKYKCDKFDVPLYAVMTKSGELCEFSAGECLTKDGKPLKANTDEEKIRLSVEVIKEIMPNINTEDYTFAISPYSEKTVEVFYKEWQYSNALFVSFNDEGLVHCVHNKFAGVDLDFPKLSEEFYLENAEKS